MHAVSAVSSSLIQSLVGGGEQPLLSLQWWSSSHLFSYTPIDVLVPAPGHVGVSVTNVSPVCRHKLCWHPGQVYEMPRDAPVVVGVAMGWMCLAFETEVRAQALGWRTEIGLSQGWAHHCSGGGYIFISWLHLLACTFNHDVFVCVVCFCHVAVVIHDYIKTEKEAKKMSNLVILSCG